MSQVGCGREFFRNWANQEVSAVVFEKSRDPRFRLEMFSIDPPAASRFANPFDPDTPPAPPDDPAAEALSPRPQNPKYRLMTPSEGTGYLTQLESWKAERDQREAAEKARTEAENRANDNAPDAPNDAPRDAASPNDRVDLDAPRLVPSPADDPDRATPPGPDAAPTPVPAPPAPESGIQPVTPGPNPNAAPGANRPMSLKNAEDAENPGPRYLQLSPKDLASLERNIDAPRWLPLGRRHDATVRKNAFLATSIETPRSPNRLRPRVAPASNSRKGTSASRTTTAPPRTTEPSPAPFTESDDSPEGAMNPNPSATFLNMNPASPKRVRKLWDEPTAVPASRRVAASNARPSKAQGANKAQGAKLAGDPLRESHFQKTQAEVIQTQAAQPTPGAIPTPPAPEPGPVMDPPFEMPKELGAGAPANNPAAAAADAAKVGVKPQPAQPAQSPALREKPRDADPVPPIDPENADDPPPAENSFRERVNRGPSAEDMKSALPGGARNFVDDPLKLAEIIGVDPNGKLYVVDMPQSLTLGLVNSRAYQSQIEQIYVSSLAVTLQRYNLSPQFYAGLSPTTGTQAGIASNPGNRFNYRTKEAPGGGLSTLSLGTAAGVGKVFTNGARLLTGFANTTVFNFGGSNPRNPTVQSVIPISLVMPLLADAGKAVTMEALTQAERDLLYQIRTFARFRKQFLTSIVVGGAAAAGGGGGAADPSIGYLTLLQQYLVVRNTQRNLADFENYLVQFTELATGEPSGLTEQNVGLTRQSVQTTRSSLVQAIVTFRNSLDSYKIQLGLPPDLPLVIDRGPIKGFQDVFAEIEEWKSSEERSLEELTEIIEHLPQLENIKLDELPVLDEKYRGEGSEALLLIAERIALTNRLDLMNARAQLYDAWRQLAVAANGLRGVLNVGMTNQIFTPPNTSNPLAFSSQAKDLSITLNAELPLIRVAERNAFQTARINYQRAQRTLMQLEDNVKLAVRQNIRDLQRIALQYDLQKSNMEINIKNIDNTIEQIYAPPAAGVSTGASSQLAQTQNLLNQQNSLLGTQNTVVQLWVNYQQSRLNLYRDLDIMPYDEWEAFYEFFPPGGTGGN